MCEMLAGQEGEVELHIDGLMLDGSEFSGTDVITVIDKADKKK